LSALAVSLLAALPLFYITLRALEASPEVWTRLWQGQFNTLLWQTIQLVVATMALAALIGVAAAWLVERTDLPARAMWRWLLALPLALPAYVVAACTLILLRRGGVVDLALMNWLGLAQGQVPLPNIFNLGGAAAVISLCVYPYVYVPVAAALRSINRSLEEAARMSGSSVWHTLRTVTLPLVLPPLVAGMLLVALYALSDFGTVALMRYNTFTTAIFNQFAGQVDRAGAATLSFVLITLTLPLLLGESWFTGRGKRFTTNTTWKPIKPLALGRWRWLALAFVVLIGLLALGIPLLVLGGLALQALLFPTALDEIWRVGSDSVWQHSLNSIIVAGVAATLATALACVPAYFAARYPRWLARVLVGISKVAYALPGLIVGLACVMLFNQWLSPIYGTVVALVLGFVLRLLPQSVSTAEAALKAVPPTLDQAARVMGSNARQSLLRVVLPAAAPGMLASWVLVFITAMKELPTAILLRPPGFDTLPVRIWSAASESVYTQAALPAFLLIVLTMLPLMLLYSRGFYLRLATE
jgi:iron(III) transport system permease protein